MGSGLCPLAPLLLAGSDWHCSQGSPAALHHSHPLRDFARLCLLPWPCPLLILFAHFPPGFLWEHFPNKSVSYESLLSSAFGEPKRDPESGMRVTCWRDNEKTLRKRGEVECRRGCRGWQCWFIWDLVGCDRSEFFPRAVGNYWKRLGREVTLYNLFYENRSLWPLCGEQTIRGQE